MLGRFFVSLEDFVFLEESLKLAFLSEFVILLARFSQELIHVVLAGLVPVQLFDRRWMLADFQSRFVRCCGTHAAGFLLILAVGP